MIIFEEIYLLNKIFKDKDSTKFIERLESVEYGICEIESVVKLFCKHIFSILSLNAYLLYFQLDIL